MKLSTYKTEDYRGIKLTIGKTRYFVFWNRGLGWGYATLGGKANGS